MQFIMNNRLYDSASSTMIGENWNGKTGLTCYCETLYRKDNGEYWLHIVGGAMTSLARPTGINNPVPDTPSGTPPRRNFL